MPKETLFAPTADTGDDLQAFPLLVIGSPLGGRPPLSGAPLTVERVEALLRRLYRLDDAFGGNELCLVIADQVRAASSLFNVGSLNPTMERRLFAAVAGLTQIAGWLSLDANRHGDTSRYLSATIYAAHEIDDLGL